MYIHEHTQVMYGDGCPWRSQHPQAQQPASSDFFLCTPTRPGVAAHGLYQLQRTVSDALAAILTRYAPGLTEGHP